MEMCNMEFWLRIGVCSLLLWIPSYAEEEETRENPCKKEYIRFSQTECSMVAGGQLPPCAAELQLPMLSCEDKEQSKKHWEEFLEKNTTEEEEMEIEMCWRKIDLAVLNEMEEKGAAMEERCIRGANPDSEEEDDNNSTE